MSEWGRVLPANMEPAAAFVGRADKWWKEHVVDYVSSLGRGRPVPGGGNEDDRSSSQSSDPVHILVVSHGGFIRVLVQSLLGSRKVLCGKGVELDGRMRCANASITVIEMESGGKGRLVLFADTTHLDGELVENVDIVDDGGQQSS